jgi:starch phosphorylase
MENLSLPEIFEFLEIENPQNYSSDINEKMFFGYPLAPIIEAEKNLLKHKPKPTVAYFSMEFGLAPSIYQGFRSSTPVDSINIVDRHEVFSNLSMMDYYHLLPLQKILDLPIYSGGLGVLAGDTLKTAADLGLPFVGVGILWNKGYFKQQFWFKYGQIPSEEKWDPFSFPGLVPTKRRLKIKLGPETMILRVWKYYVFSHSRTHVVPLILLDGNLKENSKNTRHLTDQLYRSENTNIKIAQRLILGGGGVRALEELKYQIDLYHLNEGHAAAAFLEKSHSLPPDKIDDLKKSFTYTCHTPVAAGHDRFALKDLGFFLEPAQIELLKKMAPEPGHPELANLTIFSLNLSKNVNAVSKRHQEVMALQFPQFKDKIQHVTNGVHLNTWVSPPIAHILDEYKEKIGPWRENPELLNKVKELKNDPEFRKKLWSAHQENKNFLAKILKFWFFQEDVFTLGWARRITPYKRPSLILQDVQKLVTLAKQIGPIQIILAGKSHPSDNIGATFVEEMLNKIDSLSHVREYLKIFFLENYDTFFGKTLTSGVDLWLNNPLPPFEASGTSGMKAISNGVLQLTTIDGWVPEAVDKEIGFTFGYTPSAGVIGEETNLHLAEDSQALYEKLEEILRLYYRSFKNGRIIDINSRWLDLMINCLAAASYFNTHRMVKEYQEKIWT